MSTPRNLNGIPASLFQGPGIVDWSFYARIDFGSPVRYTDRPNGDVRDVGDGNGSQTWVGDRLMVIGALEQSQDDPLEVQTIQLGNLDGVWTAYGIAPDGIRLTPIEIFAGWFDPDTGLFAGALQMFSGYLDAADIIVPGSISIALRPFQQSYQKQTPWRTFSKIDFPLILAPGTVVQWGPKSVTAQGAQAVKSTVGGGSTPPPPPNNTVRGTKRRDQSGNIVDGPAAKVITPDSPAPATGVHR